MMGEIKAMVDGGKASAGPPIGPALAPTGVNIGDVVAKINEKTASYAGMKVPIKVIINANKTFEIEVGSPPMSALIKKEAGISKAAGNPKTEKVGNITIEQARKIAEMKIEDINSFNIKAAVKEVVGTCDSMGVHVEGRRAKNIMGAIDNGNFDDKLK